MTDRLKEPLPCPCCDQEMIPVDTYNNKVLWQHPSNRCALIYVSLNNSYRVELWNTRPREAKLEAKVKKLREALNTTTGALGCHIADPQNHKAWCDAVELLQEEAQND